MKFRTSFKIDIYLKGCFCLGKKIVFSCTLVSVIIFLLWGVLTINLIVTDAFNSMENERYVVNYDDIKEKVGVDLKSFSNDNAFLKSYNSKEGLIIGLGKYFINLDTNVVTKIFSKSFYFITDTVNTINNYVYDIFY